MPREQGEPNNEGQEPENNGQQQDDGSSTGPEKTVDWYEKELTKTRNEAASWRTQLRDVQEQLKNAKTPEEFEAARAELESRNKDLERELLKAKVAKGDPTKNIPALPDDLAALLKGDTEEELNAHAEVLRKYVTPQGAPPGRLVGGLDPNQGGDSFDVKDVARRARLGQL
jgi:hypothetical protein